MALGMMEIEWWQVWVTVAILLFIVEIFTSGFFAACVAIGAVLAAVAAACGLGPAGQLIFLAVGILGSFFLVRPFVLKYLHRKERQVLTNVDALVGQVARVTVKVDNASGQGRVFVNGDDWRAVSADGSVFGEGDRVRVLKVDSTILTVEKAEA